MQHLSSVPATILVSIPTTSPPVNQLLPAEQELLSLFCFSSFSPFELSSSSSSPFELSSSFSPFELSSSSSVSLSDRVTGTSSVHQKNAFRYILVKAKSNSCFPSVTFVHNLIRMIRTTTREIFVCAKDVFLVIGISANNVTKQVKYHQSKELKSDDVQQHLMPRFNTKHPSKGHLVDTVRFYALPTLLNKYLSSTKYSSKTSQFLECLSTLCLDKNG